MQTSAQKIGLYALLGILAFALIFAFLPTTGRITAQTGATLRGVQLRLYPGRDPDAVWSFNAQNVTNDPVANETHLTGLSGGQRILRERNAAGQLTGKEVLDATLSAPDLTIDGQDNMTTRQARITLVKHCAAIELKGVEGTPVKIEQSYGFSAPIADIKSPNLVGHAEKLRMSFQFVSEDMDDAHSNVSANLDATETCQDGKIVSLKP